MNASNKIPPAHRKALTGAFGVGLALSMAACNLGQETNSPVGVGAKETPLTQEAPTPTLVNEKGALSKPAAATYLHFGDRTACTWNPGICQTSGVWWPGYIQNAGGDTWLYAWQSSGPWTNPLGNQPTSEFNPHFHILGLQNAANEPNPLHTAMRGDWWSWFAVKRGNARVNFDLTQINVLGTVPVIIWFKTAAGQGLQWSRLGPGRWNLPGAANIQEVHIRAASGNRADIFKIDDLQITPR